jgi:ubiquinone/menaquinone biosynthesis C-methylase UbiE
MILGRSGDAAVVERLSGLRSDDAVVDIGCGPGTAVRRAAKLGATATGVDPALVMLRVARLLTRPSASVHYVEGSAEDLPLPDDSASVVWSIASVHHWKDLDAGLREVLRVLGPGGRLVALERLVRPSARGLASHGWTDEQAAAFAGLCLEHGSVNTRVDRHTYGRRTTVSVTATAP